MKTKSLANRVPIYLTANGNSIPSYFNAHDPSPIYSRQLSHEFEQYLSNSIAVANRWSVIQYKITCVSSIDRLFTEPLVEAVRKHFTIKKTLKEKEFRKFKKRAVFLLILSFSIAMTGQWLLPFVIGEESAAAHSGLTNALDVFSWVIMWKPIERLIFGWNPYLKELSILNKLITAEATILEDEKAMDPFIPDKKETEFPPLRAESLQVV